MSYELTIHDPDAPLEATFIPELGMIGCSLRHQGEELFAQLGGADGYRQRGSTFALPLLHPWANRLASWNYEVSGLSATIDPNSPGAHRDGATGLPIHGLLTASPDWQVLDADRDHLVAELDFGADPKYLAGFPFPHTVRYEASLADSALSIVLTVRPTTEQSVPIAFGFHPYLTLPGSDRRDWTIELPVARQVVLDAQMLPTPEGIDLKPGELDGLLADRTFDTSFDRLHAADDGTATFVLADQRRRIETVFGPAYDVAQVYTPASADFICFEPMTAPVNALISGQGLRFVEPGQAFSAEFKIAVSASD